MSNENKQTKPKYTLEFKQDAAKLVIKNGYTQQQAADHLGVSLSAIGHWEKAVILEVFIGDLLLQPRFLLTDCRNDGLEYWQVPVVNEKLPIIAYLSSQ